MRTKKVKVGIMSMVDYKARTIKIAKGEYKAKKEEPKIWFNSIQSLANVLSEENQRLLKLIIDLKPKSISALEAVTGRKANNLLRTLRTMENYGFVKLVEGPEGRGRRPLVPKVVYDSADITFDFNKISNQYQLKKQA